MTVPVEEWKERAACADLTLEESERIFFGVGAAQLEGARMCAGCPVWAECRDYADAFESGINRTFGVWGGEVASERVERRRAARNGGGDVVALAG